MNSKTITRNKIKARLTELGISQAEIAIELGVTRSAVGRTLAGNSRSARIMEAVARRLNTTVDKLWRRAA